jgi:hypothetical protein
MRHAHQGEKKQDGGLSMFKLRAGMAALALATCANVAFAQTTTTTPAETAPMKSEAATGTDQTPPLAGANSFTEDQARERIAEAGFQDVKALKQDDKGVWRGQAMKSGAQVSVALDYRGNVVQQ